MSRGSKIIVKWTCRMVSHSYSLIGRYLVRYVFLCGLSEKKYAIVHTENQIALVINAFQHWLWHRPAQRPVNT